MTAFETKFLKILSADIFLGQISYKQKAEIYNYTHGYDQSTKKGPKPYETFHEERFVNRVYILYTLL